VLVSASLADDGDASAPQAAGGYDGFGPDYAVLGVSWPSTTITWSAAQYNYQQDTAAGVSFSSSLDPTTQAIAAAAFARWSEASGLHFVEVPDSPTYSGAADIRIGFAPLPGSGDGQTLGLTQWSTQGGFFQPDVTIRLEDSTVIPLVQQPGGPLYYSGFDATVYQTVTHEIGHAIGLGHSATTTAVMYPFASTINPDIATDDIAGIAAVYPASAGGIPPLPTFPVTDTSASVSFNAVGSNYQGPVPYLRAEFIYAGLDSINVSSPLPNVFLHGGALDDALAVTGGQNVLDGGSGSNFLVGASGTDTFFVDDRNATADIWSTMVGFHTGDAATVWGVTVQDFTLSWADDEGASGYTGLTFHATRPGAPTASLTLPGYSTADLSNGRLTFTSGYDSASGSNYLYLYGQS